MATIRPDDIDASYRPCPVGSVVHVDAEGERILFDPERRVAHTLNDTGALMWQVFDCDGSIGEIAADVADTFSIDVATAEADITGLVRQLGRAGLLEDVGRVAAATAAPDDCDDDEGPAQRDPFSEPPYIAVPPNN